MVVRETDAECAEELRKGRQEHKGASQGVGERGTETAASYRICSNIGAAKK